MRKMIYTLLGMFFLMALGNTSIAQETTSEIVGSVTDNGNPVNGATIVAVHNPTGTKYSTTTRKDGRFNLPNLKVGGPYTITVSFVGFKADAQENVMLLLGQDYKADFLLVPESKTLTEVVVTSTSQNKIFNSSRTGSQEIISRTQLERLPTINRSLQDFTKLTPSANGLSFGGRNGSFNNVTVDGANFNNVFGLSGTLGGQTNSQPISLDAIEQIQVNISPYDVRQGGFSGAGINSVTRSGTNTFKGSVYTYLRSEGLQGYNVRTSEIPKTNLEYNLRGFSLGGPVIKNKLFFFISGEQERLSTPATSFVANKPGGTAGGNVSQAVADTLDALKAFLIDKFNYNPGEYQGYNYRTHSDKITVKLDWNINKSNTFTIKYNYLKSFRDAPPSNSGSVNSANGRAPNTTGLPFSGSGYTINNNFNILIAELNTRFTNKASNKLQIGYTALRDFRASLAGGDFPMVDILNGAGLPYTNFGYEPFTYNNVLNSDVFQFSDIFTMYKGAHEITLGTQNYYKKFKNGFAPNYEGVYRFNSLTAFYNSVNNNAPGASRYDLQYSVTKDGSFPYAEIGATELGFFAQDKWRVNKKLTITYGLRLDLPLFEDKFTVNDAVSSLTFRDGKQYNVGQKPGTNALISPRAGFNYDVFGNKKTQLRGGVGVFAGPPPFVWISNQASNNGVQFGSFSKVAGSGGVLATDPVFTFNPDINANRPAAGAAPTQYGLVFTDEGFKYPQVFKASAAIDQKLPGDITATVEYTFSKDINAVYFQNVNLPSTGKSLVGWDGRIRYDSTKIYGGKPTPSIANPNINNAILMTNSNKGYAYTLTLQLQKTFKNLYASVAYTYSEAKSINDGGSIASSMWRDRPVTADPNSTELGFSNFYQPHRVIASASYRKEYAKYFATSFGFIFEAAPNGVGSYTYNGDVNNDGTGGNNDLIYIPRDATEILLVPVNTGGGTITDTRTAAQTWAQLDNFIKQDPYLSSHRGEYAQRNAAVLPFFKRLDFNITQDFYLNSGKANKEKHTLRITFDIINAGNLLNKNWGIYKTFNTTTPLKFEGLVTTASDPNFGKPRYSFPYLDAANQIPVVNSYRDDTNIISRWQGQLGIRYIFN